MKDSKKKESKKEAKMKVLKDLHNMMGGEMQKVSVMAKDKKGLEEGLDKAKEILKKKDLMKGK